MSLITCGLNHQTAPLALRERVVFAPERLSTSLQDLVTMPAVDEAVILSTCNRTELYCASHAQEHLIAWLCQHHGLSVDELTPHLYIHHEASCVQHALRVASGLDSMVLGEPQIFGQMKSAYHKAQAAGTLGSDLHALFQYTFAAAKKVRTDTNIGSNPITMAYTILDIAKKIFAKLSQKSVLLLGAGEMMSLIARYLHDHQVRQLTIANRTKSKAQELARHCQGLGIGLESLALHLPDADLIITGISHPMPVIGKGLIERCLRQRKHRPMLLVDLGVPRNIEPEVAELEDVYLYTLDDLQALIAEHQQHRQQAASQAENLITTHSQDFIRKRQARKSTQVICAYRRKMSELSQYELQRAKAALNLGHDPQQVVERLTHNLINKIMHEPSTQLQQAGYNNQLDLMAAARELFGLELE